MLKSCFRNVLKSFKRDLLKKCSLHITFISSNMNWSKKKRHRKAKTHLTVLWFGFSPQLIHESLTFRSFEAHVWFSVFLLFSLSISLFSFLNLEIEGCLYPDALIHMFFKNNNNNKNLLFSCSPNPDAFHIWLSAHSTDWIAVFRLLINSQTGLDLVC